jgi:hypothetical protein
MENLLGMITNTARLKEVSAQYALIFMESGMVAVRTGEALFAVGYLSNTGRLISNWVDVVIDVNQTKKSIVSYDQKNLQGDFPKKSLNFPYEKIKSVNMKKVTRDDVDVNKLQYGITFNMGMFSFETFFIPGASLEEVTELIKKTPLSGKLQ